MAQESWTQQDSPVGTSASGASAQAVPTLSRHLWGHSKASLLLEGCWGLSGPGHCRWLTARSSLSLQGAQTLTALPRRLGGPRSWSAAVGEQAGGIPRRLQLGDESRAGQLLSVRPGSLPGGVRSAGPQVRHC